MQCCFTIPFLSSHTFSLFMPLSVSHSKCLSMHIALSNECLMCAAQRQGGSTIFLSTSKQQSTLSGSNRLSTRVCGCVRVHAQTPFECAYEKGRCICVHTFVCVCARVCASLACVWDVQLSGSATGGECWSVSLFAPSLPPHITT